ncbi:hypothetical protein BCR32DRAFT_245881 [Anaeromyces robustus]|uniref:Uncharacterized protein n=1 Tax=Anaeromyces robustus TaxID=1754192 RepID=A0A1Y1X358_9FUNG|nr:hypothetical protein BCR32DRAFT_245881 [Anaeromyces robustus]|eukprot:ORX80068.1 hypothetical protein BCR32DRAFT_245881 [Anaeromyces robustus]
MKLSIILILFMVIDLSLCSLDAGLAAYACSLITFVEPLLGGLCTVVSSTAQIVGYFQGKKHDFKLSHLKKNSCESFYICPGDTHEVCAAEGQFLHYATNTGKYSDSRALGTVKISGNQYAPKHICGRMKVKNNGLQEVCNHVKLCSTNTPNNEKGFDMVKDKNSHSCYIYSLLFDENCRKADKLTAGECIDLDHLIIKYC